MKLGEALIRLGVIDETQLHDALEAQLIYGGHLGTCLIERGLITEKQLGQVLAKLFGVGCATTSMFENIPKYVIDSLPRPMVEKHSAVPFRLADGTLDVALLNPTDLQTIDELSFASGRKVVPWVAPEVRLLQAMDRYYDVARRMRYITLARQLDDEADTVVGLDSAVAPPLPGRTEPAAGRAEASRSARGPATAAPSATARAALARSAAAVIERARQVTGTTPSAGTTTAAGHAGSDPLESLSTLLCRVAGQPMLGKIVLEHVAPGAARCLLFNMQRGAAAPWDWRGIDLDRREACEIRFPLANEPVFRLLGGEGVYRGAVPPDACYRGFFATLGIEPPGEMILLQCCADDRMVALLYFDSAEGPTIEEDTSTFLRIARKVGLALRLIEIKQRIRNV